MLRLLIGTDWVSNRDAILQLVAHDVAEQKTGRILIVPELISHDAERRLCEVAGDASSRYAEVLSFTRLVRRVAESTGVPSPECLDNGGRIVAMASAANQLHSKLKTYASVETRPEFLTALVDAVDEFKRCNISANDLMQASARAEGTLAQKLEELSLLLSTYNALCEQGKRDPRDQMTWLLEELEDSTFPQEHTFYIDGFPDFTIQHMEIILYLLSQSSDITISLTCDKPGSTTQGFEKAGETASQLIRGAEKYGIAYQIEYIPNRNNVFSDLSGRLFVGAIADSQHYSNLTVRRAASVYQECLATADQIIQLVHSGARYRDIGVVCADMEKYRGVLQMVLERCQIPVYLSGTDEVLGKPVVKTVLNGLEAALGGFESQEVFDYLRSAVSPISLSQCDALENYVSVWGINRNQWLNVWHNHPGGLGAKTTDESVMLLNELELNRQLVIEPLRKLCDGFKTSQNLGQQVIAVYNFLEDIHFSKRLSELAERLDANGDNRTAQILNQLWEILLSALEQLYDVLGETHWDSENFIRLFKLLLSQYDVGTIPPVLDSVTVGPVNVMRCQQTKHLFVLGSNEGMLPGYGGISGVLTDQERLALRQMGVPLTGGALDGLQTEFAEIYGVFCGAEESITVSCVEGQASFLFNRLSEMAGGEQRLADIYGAALVDRFEASAYVLRHNLESRAKDLGIAKELDDLLNKIEYKMGDVSRSSIDALYGDTLNLSASQIDRYADCHLSYFLQYGLCAKELKTATVDPAEFGTYIHTVLERTAKKVKELGGFQRVNKENVIAIANSFSDAYISERFQNLDTQRTAYLFNRNKHELELIVEELWKELHDIQFSPDDFEVGFGYNESQPAIQFFGKEIAARLRGFVDRIDIWQTDDKTYYRVVDYKTGKKDFDYCDIYNGLGLQMLLYLFALRRGAGSKNNQNLVPAGVQYFPARVPLVSADGQLTKEEADAEREKLWKRKGLLLNEDSVLDAMDSNDAPGRLPFTRRKDGTKNGDLASSEKLDMLEKYVCNFVAGMIDDIASGKVSANPYTRGSSHNACTFCPYGAVCHNENVTDRRNYEAISQQKFWEDVERSVKNNG